MGPVADTRTQCRRARFSDSLVADLRSLALAGIGGLAGEGTETGGILLGEIIGEELRLNACEEVPCEHPGPCYTLGASDRIRLEEVLATRGGAFGFFRTFLNNDPTPDDIDPQFVQRYFPRGDCVYLMLRVVSADQCNATVVWLRDGQPLTLDGPTTFPLQPGGVPMLRVRPVLPAPARSRSTAAAPTSGPRPRWKPVVACVFLGALAGAGFELWSLNNHTPDEETAIVQPPKPSWSDLQLDAHPTGHLIDITWSAGAVRALNATAARLTITDGATRHEFSLGSAIVNSGTYRYTATHSNLAVRLIVMSGGQGVASDSVRLTSAVAEVPSPAAPPPQSAAVPAAPVHEVQPDIPAGIRSRLATEVKIPVAVRVNERGRVLSAQVEDTSGSADGLHRYLVGQAEKAAREWQFTPARTRTGIPIPSDKTIQFVITP